MEPEQRHVAALAFPFGTHAPPLLSILSRLAALSPTTLFSFLTTSACISSATNGVALPPNLKAYDVKEGYVPTGMHHVDMQLFIGTARGSFEEALERAVEESGGTKVTCLITDAFFWFGRELADRIGCGVLWLPFWTAGPNALSAHFHTDLLRQTFGTEDAVAGRENEFLKPIPGMSKITVADLPEGVVVGRLDSLFSDMLHRMGQTLPLADAVFINCFEELDPDFTNDLKSKLKGYLNIGPLNLVSPPRKSTDHNSCIEWLNGRHAASVAYIGFGTVTMPPPQELAALADALEAKEVPFIWSLKDSARGHLPDGFLERTSSRGLVVPWAPQTEILRHSAVGVFVTHSGWNSVLESVVGGVPMICRPFFGDQRLNARAVADVWGIGRRVEGGTLTKDGVLNCLDEVLVGENGKKMRGAIEDLRRKAIAAVGPRGSTTNNFTTLLELVTATKK